MFEGDEDPYKGVTVDSANFKANVNPQNFNEKLLEAEEQWRKNGKRGIWFKIRNSVAEVIPILIRNKYTFHHANPEYAMLKKWLPNNEPDNIPLYPYTFIGVGGLVLNGDRVLLVKEKYSLTSKWKLPGGHVDSGEDLGQAARREVKEETGIDTQDIGIVTIRHTHPHPLLNFPSHSCSDIYVIVLLTTSDEQTLSRQEAEIAEVEWHQIEKILKSDDIHEHNKNFIREGIKRRESGQIIKMESEIFKFKDIERTMSMYKINSI